MWKPFRRILNGFALFGRDEYWVCKYCGQHNHEDLDVCIACDYPRDFGDD